MMYGNEKNPSRVYEIYECLFELKHGDKHVSEFYRELKSLIEELKMHKHIVTDVVILRGYRQDLAVSKFYVWLESLTTTPGAKSDTGWR